MKIKIIFLELKIIILIIFNNNISNNSKANKLKDFNPNSI